MIWVDLDVDRPWNLLCEKAPTIKGKETQSTVSCDDRSIEEHVVLVSGLTQPPSWRIATVEGDVDVLSLKKRQIPSDETCRIALVMNTSDASLTE